MRPVQVASIALAAMITGAAAGYFVGADSNQQAPPSVAPIADEADTPVANVKRVDPQPPAEHRAPSNQTLDDSAKDDALAAWIRSLAEFAPKPGTGRIHGQVRREDESPIAGVAVSVWPLQEQDRWYSAADPLEESLQDYARRMHFIKRGLTTVTTGADGLFEVKGLGEYTFVVEAQANGYQFVTWEDHAYRAEVKPDAEVDFLAKPQCEVRIVVKLPDGTETDEAEVGAITPSGGHSSHFWRRGQPHWFAPGTYQFMAKAGHLLQFSTKPVEVELKEGDAPRTLELQLKAEPGIMCELILPPGAKPDFEFCIFLIADPPERAPIVRDTHAARNTNLYGFPAHFYPGLEHGRYRIGVCYAGAIAVWKDVTFSEDFLTVTLEVPALNRADFIVVRVFSPTGELLPNANVGARLCFLNWQSEMDRYAFDEAGGGHVVKRPDGEFWVLRTKEKGKYYYEIFASTQELAGCRVRYDEAGTADLDIRIPAPATLVVQVPGVQTHPLRKTMHFNLIHVAERQSFSPDQPASSSGDSANSGLKDDKIKFGPLAPGKYELRVSAAFQQADGTPNMAWLGKWDFDLVSGENVKAIELAQLYKLTIVIPEPDQLRSLMVRRLGTDDSQARYVDRKAIKARLVIEGLIAGQWIIETEEGQMRVRMSADTEVTLAITAFNCLGLWHIKSGGKIEGMGFRNGDLLTRVDGQEWAGVRELERQANASWEKETATWTVLRGGVATAVTFNGKAMYELLNNRDENGEQLYLHRTIKP